MCASCGKRFNRPSSLKIHEHSHTGAKPFPCPFPNCGRSFSVSSNMRRHYRNHSQQKHLPPTQAEGTQEQRQSPKDLRIIPQISVQHAKGDEKSERINPSSPAILIKHSHSPLPSIKHPELHHPQTPYGHAASAPMTPPYTNDGSELDQESYRRSDSTSASRIDGDIDGRSTTAATPTSANVAPGTSPWESYSFSGHAVFGDHGSGAAEHSTGYGYNGFQEYGASAPSPILSALPSYPAVQSGHEQYAYAPNHPSTPLPGQVPLDPAFVNMLDPSITRHDSYASSPHAPSPASMLTPSLSNAPLKHKVT